MIYSKFKVKCNLDQVFLCLRDAIDRHNDAKSPKMSRETGFAQKFDTNPFLDKMFPIFCLFNTHNYK